MELANWLNLKQINKKLLVGWEAHRKILLLMPTVNVVEKTGFMMDHYEAKYLLAQILNRLIYLMQILGGQILFMLTLKIQVLLMLN